MAKIQKATSYPGHEKRKTTPIHDQIQIALALANQESLIDLLVNSNPPIVSLTKNQIREDHALKFLSHEFIRSGRRPEEWEVENIELKDTDWHSLTCQVEVPIPRKSYAVDGIINFDYTQTTIVTFSHADSEEGLFGTSKFDGKGRALIEIKTEIQSWADTLRQIKRYQTELKIEQSILVCDTLTELEAQGFMSQGVSIYPATYLTLPIYADCSICVSGSCPMSGTQNSPVTMCRGFDTIDGWLSNDKQIEGSEEF